MTTFLKKCEIINFANKETEGVSISIYLISIVNQKIYIYLIYIYLYSFEHIP